MAKEKIAGIDIHRQIYKVRKESKEEYLKLLGVDIPNLRRFEKQIDGKYERLISRIQKNVKSIGKENEEMQKASFQRMTSIYQLEVAKTVGQTIDSNIIAVLRPCRYFFNAEYEDIGDHGPIINPSTGGTGTGATTYDNRIAHPYVNVRGQGSGTTNSVSLETWFKYSFMPQQTKTYCINPFIYLNGHWLLWTWGGGCGSTGDVGRGHVKLTLRLTVDQLSVTVHEREKVIIDQYAEEGADYETGFAYNSEVNPGLGTRVVLQAGDQAVIWVKCECNVEIGNHGRAWIDMQTSPYFYFMTPEVKWGWPVSQFAWPF